MPYTEAEKHGASEVMLLLAAGALTSWQLSDETKEYSEHEVLRDAARAYSDARRYHPDQIPATGKTYLTALGFDEKVIARVQWESSAFSDSIKDFDVVGDGDGGDYPVGSCPRALKVTLGWLSDIAYAPDEAPDEA